MYRTKTEAALAEAQSAHADDPERAELLGRARRFKASWIDLAEALTRAKRGHRRAGIEHGDAPGKSGVLILSRRTQRGSSS